MRAERSSLTLLRVNECMQHSTSVFFFDSSEFARLRTQVRSEDRFCAEVGLLMALWWQIRLKLTEIPSIHQTRRSASTYSDALELLSEYLPYLLALMQFQSPDNRRQPQQHMKQPLDAAVETTSFPPLFYGFDSIDLSTDRLVGREQRTDLTVMVDLVLTLFTLAQMQALYAEAQVEQATRLQNSGLLQIGEAAWQDARRLFDRASAFANHAQSELLQQGTSLLGTVLNFFGTMVIKARVLGYACSIHSMSSRICFVRDVAVVHQYR